MERQRFWSGLTFPLVYRLLRGSARRIFKYSIANAPEFRSKIWPRLDRHRGPVLWVFNHASQIDPLIICWPLFSAKRLRRMPLFPWPLVAKDVFTPPARREFNDFYPYIQSRFWFPLIKAAMYLLRCIPIHRTGEDSAAVRSRELAYEKSLWALRNGGWVMLSPEAHRPRNGWFERNRPKDLIGDMALRSPGAAIVCVYLRAEGQTSFYNLPPKGSAYRLVADWIDPLGDSNESARAVSRRVFDKLAALQEEWFRRSSMPKNCAGNDVVDLADPRRREPFDFDDGAPRAEPAWLGRHLTPNERARLEDRVKSPDPYRAFWKMFAAKEAAYKAFVQAGIEIPRAAYTMLETDLFRNRVAHLPSGSEAEIAFVDEGKDRVHCVSVFRGGWIGDEQTPGDVVWGLREVPSGVEPSACAWEGLLALIAETSDEIESPRELAATCEGSIPKVLWRGKSQDWGVSLSHSGRFAAYSFMIS